MLHWKIATDCATNKTTEQQYINRQMLVYHEHERHVKSDTDQRRAEKENKKCTRFEDTDITVAWFGVESFSSWLQRQSNNVVISIRLCKKKTDFVITFHMTIDIIVCMHTAYELLQPVCKHPLH